ncbi:hypothetical protein NST04_33275 [Paenibacillus sp. FSL H7-0756]|uniref:hypothetical protein n=1 Tax=unclassified Paenibacillus TaxID=185978 RepID=UPI0030FC7621
MRVLLLAGIAHGYITAHIADPWTTMNDGSLRVRDTAGLLQNSTLPGPEAVVITDEGLPDGLAADKESVHTLLEHLSQTREDTPVIILTRDPGQREAWSSLVRQYLGLSVLEYHTPRLPIALVKQALAQLADRQRNNGLGSGSLEMRFTPARESEPGELKAKKRSFLDRFRSKGKDTETFQSTDSLSRELANISRGMSRVVAVTGHRGSGLTSTAVNLAAEAAKRGLNTILVDMDTEYRGINLYFSGFDEQAHKDEHLGSSLIRMLAKPQDYRTNAFPVQGNLWMTTLSYGFQDKRAIQQFYTSEKLAGLLSALRNNFNLVVLDLPLDAMRQMESALIHMDTFGLCVPNNLYSVLSTLRNIELVLDRDSAAYLNAKTKVIVTRYNHSFRYHGDLFTPEKVGELLGSGLSDSFRYEPALAGYVPASAEFDQQIESDIPIVNSGPEFERAFGTILLRLMEGSG